MNPTTVRLRLATVAASALAVLAAVTLPAGPAAATTPLPAPGTPVLTAVTQTSVAISWSAPTGPVANYTVQYFVSSVGYYLDAGTTSATSFTHTGLTADTPYTYRVVANPQPGSGYTASPISGLLYVTTQPLPDYIAPTKPGSPSAYPVSTEHAEIRYTASTDNNRVAGYVAQRQVNGVWTDMDTNNNTVLYLRNLTPATTYTVVIVAFDPNGNRSPRSDPVTFTTKPTQPLPTCKVQLINIWNSYILNASLENMTAATVLSNWAVTFTMPAAQTVIFSVNTKITRTGDLASAGPSLYNGTINPGYVASFTLQGSLPAGSPMPSGFTLNGTIPCTS